MDTVGIEPTTFHTRSQRRCEAKIIPLDQAPDVGIMHLRRGSRNIKYRQFGRLDLRNAACWGPRSTTRPFSPRLARALNSKAFLFCLRQCGKVPRQAPSKLWMSLRAAQVCVYKVRSLRERGFFRWSQVGAGVDILVPVLDLHQSLISHPLGSTLAALIMYDGHSLLLGMTVSAMLLSGFNRDSI